MIRFGMCHPPAGLNLYVASGITELTKAVMPWLLTMLLFLVLITYIPQITMVLPNLIYQ
ncbi:MAG: C4-dicarboxylate transporter permease [Herbaspirillum sp.]|nr:C4-dicarboxylate transporter permease [Herbaspirillum sp.]